MQVLPCSACDTKSAQERNYMHACGHARGRVEHGARKTAAAYVACLPPHAARPVWIEASGCGASVGSSVQLATLEASWFARRAAARAWPCGRVACDRAHRGRCDSSGWRRLPLHPQSIDHAGCLAAAPQLARYAQTPVPASCSPLLHPPTSPSRWNDIDGYDGDLEITVEWYQRDISGGDERRIFKRWTRDPSTGDPAQM